MIVMHTKSDVPKLLLWYWLSYTSYFVEFELRIVRIDLAKCLIRCKGLSATAALHWAEPTVLYSLFVV